jgi:competence protein ComEC
VTIAAPWPQPIGHAPSLANAAGRRLGDLLAAERERLVLWLPVVLAIGVAGYFSLKAEPPAWSGAAVVAAGLMIGLATPAAPAHVRSWLGGTALVVALLGIGFAAAQARTAIVAAPMLQQRLGPVVVRGEVAEVERLPEGLRLVIDRPRLAGPGLPVDERYGRVRIRLRGDTPPIRPGVRVRLRAVLTPPPPPAAPGAFDFQRHAYFEGLSAVGFALGRIDIEPPESGSGTGFAHALARLRHTIGERIRAGQDTTAGAIVGALLIGEQRSIPEPDLQAMRDSGLAHLLSISGLHFSLVAGFVFGVVRAALALIPAVALRRPIKKWAAVASFGAAGVYMLLAGATVPSQRAFLMLSAVLLAVLLDRRAISMRLVAWAAAVILLFRPEVLLGASFQMSFAAVVALVAVYEAFRPGALTAGGAVGPGRRLLVYLAGVALTSLIASAATTPFSAFHFNRVALYGLIANIIAVPITGFWIMPWGVAVLLLMPVGLEALALAPMAWGVDAVVAVARAVAAWPGAVLTVPALPTAALAAVALGGLWLALWRRPWRWCGIVPWAAVAVVVALASPPDVLVDGEGKLLAVRDRQGGLIVSSARAGAMIRDTWLRRTGGVVAAERWPRDGATADGILACDPFGCLYRASDGRRVALTRTPAALDDDCRRADLVVSTVPVRGRCPSADRVVDRFDLWREGAHAIWLGERRIVVRSVDRERGRRPWVIGQRTDDAQNEDD